MRIDLMHACGGGGERTLGSLVYTEKGGHRIVCGWGHRMREVKTREGGV